MKKAPPSRVELGSPSMPIDPESVATSGEVGENPRVAEIAPDAGRVAVEASIEATIEASGISVADQAEALANDDTPVGRAEDFVVKTGANRAGKTTRAAFAIGPDGSETRVTYDDMLKARGYDPDSYKEHKADPEAPVHKVDVLIEPIVPTVTTDEGSTPKSERPISSRRFMVESTDLSSTEAPKSKVGRVMEKASNATNRLANRMEGHSDIKADTKKIVDRQKEALNMKVDSARTERNTARSERIDTLVHNNRFARRFGSENRAQRAALRQQLMDEKFLKLGESRKRKNEKKGRAPGTEHWTDKLRKGAATAMAIAESRAEHKRIAKSRMEKARADHHDARALLDDAKNKRRSMRTSMFRSGRTLGGSRNTAYGAWVRSGEAMNGSEEEKKIRAEAEATALMAKQEKAREASKARTDEERAKLRSRNSASVDMFRERRNAG